MNREVFKLCLAVVFRIYTQDKLPRWIEDQCAMAEANAKNFGEFVHRYKYCRQFEFCVRWDNEELSYDVRYS